MSDDKPQGFDARAGDLALRCDHGVPYEAICGLCLHLALARTVRQLSQDMWKRGLLTSGRTPEETTDDE